MLGVGKGKVKDREVLRVWGEGRVMGGKRRGVRGVKM